ncbi:MAG: leucine-rich repeat domain-containing protein, partial [bacterium]|nr:leucine-rich repeat domain-containing protein [bacterium]
MQINRIQSFTYPVSTNNYHRKNVQQNTGYMSFNTNMVSSLCFTANPATKKAIKGVAKKATEVVAATAIGLTAMVGSVNNAEAERTITSEKIEAVFNDLNIEYKKDKETGLYIIDSYKVDSSDIEEHRREILQKNNITEDDLFQYIQEIKGDANFNKSEITSLGTLKKIGGNAGFYGSKVTSLGNLKEIGGDADFQCSKITSLGNLEKIGGDADFQYSDIVFLDNLKEIGGNAGFQCSKVTSLGNLEKIGGDADFQYSDIVFLDNLKEIGGNAGFQCSKVTSLGNLEKIGGDADFQYS